MAKAWWQSKTIWTAGLTVAAGVLSWILGQEWIAEHPQLVSVLLAALGISNAILRIVTGRPVEFGGRS